MNPIGIAWEKERTALIPGDLRNGGFPTPQIAAAAAAAYELREQA